MRVFNDHPRCQYSRRTIRLVHLNCSTSTLITLKKTSSLNTFSFRVQWGLLNTTNNYVKPPNFIEKRQNVFQVKWINKTGKLGLFADMAFCIFFVCCWAKWAKSSRYFAQVRILASWLTTCSALSRMINKLKQSY